MKKLLAVTMALIFAVSAQAGITTTGNVDPADPATWTSSTNSYIGKDADGTMTVNADSDVLSSNTIIGGYLSGDSGVTGTATVDGSGSTWTNSYLVVGNYGAGNLNITSGGLVTSNNGASMGANNTGVGTVTVTGPGSQWITDTEGWHWLYVGDYGDGTLNISDGGIVNSATSVIGNYTGSGAATVTGSGSQWVNTGELVIGFEGTGTLTIADGGSVSNSVGYIGTGSTGSVTVNNGTWTNSSYLYIGDEDTGTLNIENGGAVSNTIGYIGHFAGSTGTVTVDGTDSVWANSGYLGVGWEGSGTLTISNGGTVSSTMGYVGGVNGSTGTATATVTGAGSAWTNTGYLYVGRDGGASLTVADGGTVSSMAGSIATSVGTTGTVTVTGAGSQWINNDLIHIGCGITDSVLVTRGAGELNISNGGEVIAPYAVIGSTSTLSGDGTLTLNSGSGTLSNHGTIAPGNSIGTLTVDGDVVFEDGSTLAAEIDNAGNCDKLDVTGDVTINSGSTLAVNSNGETITDGKQYTLIEADGAITGEFTTVDTALVTWDTGVTSSMSYPGSTAVLVVGTSSVTPFDDLSLLRTDNQRACGRAVQQISDSGSNLGGITGALQGIAGDDNLRHAYDQLSGQTRPSIAPIADAGVSRFTGAVSRRMHSARTASLGTDGPMLAMAGNTTSVFDSRSSTTDVAAIGNGSQYDADNQYGFWTKGFGAIGDRDSEEGVNGYDYEIGGAAAGLDYQFTDNFMAGVTFGYSDADVEYSDSRDNSRIESIYSGLYGSYKDFDGYIDGIFTYTDLDSETDRYVDFVSEKNEGDFDGYEISASIEAARNYYFRDVLVQPLCGFEFGYQHQDSYTEKGGSSALRYDDQSFESYKGSLGAKASKYLCKRGEQSLWTQLRAKWMHEFGDATAGIAASFVSTPGYRFSIKDAKMNRDSAVLGTGLKYEPNRDTVLFADYDAILNGDTVAHVFSGGIRFTW